MHKELFYPYTNLKNIVQFAKRETSDETPFPSPSKK